MKRLTKAEREFSMQGVDIIRFTPTQCGWNFIKFDCKAIRGLPCDCWKAGIE